MARVLEGLGEWEVDAASIMYDTCVGSGLTSEVYRGVWEGKTVAVKKITTDFRRMPLKQREDICRELAILQALEHPNLTMMYGVVATHPVQIVMEYCAGGNVFDLLYNTPEESLTITWSQKLKLGSDVSEAMAYLHSADPPIIHRDLKSLNLLLSTPVRRSGDPILVKLSDFGMARLSKEDNMTRGRGTANWMSPEILSETKYDCKVDVYSFSMVMYEVICQEIPFEEIQDPAAIRDLILQGSRPDLSLIPPECPSRLTDLVRRCWDPYPSNRPAFEEIRHCLSEMLDKDKRTTHRG